MTIACFIEERLDGQCRVELRDGRGPSFGVLLMPRDAADELARALGSCVPDAAAPGCSCAAHWDGDTVRRERHPDCPIHGAWRQIQRQPEEP